MRELIGFIMHLRSSVGDRGFPTETKVWPGSRLREQLDSKAFDCEAQLPSKPCSILLSQGLAGDRGSSGQGTLGRA